MRSRAGLVGPDSVHRVGTVHHNDEQPVGEKTYPAPANMSDMFIKHEISSIFKKYWVAWARLDKIFTPGFYNYLKNTADPSSAPAATGDAYEDMHKALVSNNVCTGWEPQHRIQFAHSKGDMVVPYGNYLAFRDAHPDGEGNMYRVDNTFSSSDHLDAGTAFVMGIGTAFFDAFQWIDNATPVGIKAVTEVRSPMSDAWYIIDGRRLSGKPTQKGLYIVNGRKVVVK